MWRQQHDEGMTELGHANPSITLNVYSHVLPGRGAEVAQRAADLLLGTTPPST